MKTTILVLALVALATALPKPNKLHFRNLYKSPIALEKSPPKSRIVNGHEAEPNQIPYQAFFEFYDSNIGWYCGGSLISQNYLLTSGHCAHNAKIGHVTLGAYRIFDEEETQIKLISKNITIHHDFNEDEFRHDIALVQLPKPVEFTKSISAVTLPSHHHSSDNLTGRVSRVSGWGLTDGYSSDISEVLLYTDAKIIDFEECEETFAHLDAEMVCTAGGGHSSSCDGDTGGPLVVDDIQVGIASFGVLWCPIGYPFVFTRITSYLNWIELNSDVTIF